MEEDIKLLKDFIDIEGEEYYVVEEKQALENLIKEYKNLQQIEQEHKKENGALREIIKELEQNQCTHNIDNECIRKSKVREVLKELDKQEKEELKGMKGQDRYFVKQMYQYKRNILQQLLEE